MYLKTNLHIQNMHYVQQCCFETIRPEMPDARSSIIGFDVLMGRRMRRRGSVGPKIVKSILMYLAGVH